MKSTSLKEITLLCLIIALVAFPDAFVEVEAEGLENAQGSNLLNLLEILAHLLHALSKNIVFGSCA